MLPFSQMIKLSLLTGLFAILVLAAIFFRDDVSSLLSFEGRDSGVAPLPPKSGSGAHNGGIDNRGGKDAAETIPSPSPEPPPEPSPMASGDSLLPPAPSYTGRNPREIRFVPEEVQVFSEDQKETIRNEIDNYGEAVIGNPSFFHGWIQLGIAKKIVGDFEGARDAWQYAGLIAPKNVVSFANLGELYWRYFPDFPKSEQNFRQAIQNDPKRPEIYVSLAELYYYSYTEKARLAEDAYKEGLAANPDNEMLMRNIAAYYQKIGDTKNAISWWRKLLETNPPDASDLAAIIKSLEKE